MTFMEVIPVINCHEQEFGCVEEKVRLAETFRENKWIHLDVADGVFTFNKTWNNPERWKEFKTSLTLEVHLMVEHPVPYAKQWLAAGAKRIIVHSEALHGKDTSKESLEALRAMCKEHDAELMLTMNPETSVDTVRPYFGYTSAFQVLAVHPGLAGQIFLPIVLSKVRVLRGEFPDATIEVDGGVNHETARLASEAGANALASASFIFLNNDPKRAYEILRSANYDL